MITAVLEYDMVTEQQICTYNLVQLNKNQQKRLYAIAQGIRFGLITVHFPLNDFAETGKTFLYTTSYYFLLAKRKVIFYFAFSGIAA